MKTNFTIFCIAFVLLVSAEVSGRPLSSDIDKLPADEMAPLALTNGSRVFRGKSIGWNLQLLRQKTVLN